MSGRSRKEHMSYDAHKKDVHSQVECIFCSVGPKEHQFIKETKSFKVIKNIFSYSSWDEQSVEDHIMIIPKKHVDSISNFDSNESLEFMGLLSSYESRGYSIWARAPGAKTKSVVHQHTHLIKPGTKSHNILFYLKKPYMRFVK